MVAKRHMRNEGSWLVFWLSLNQRTITSRELDPPTNWKNNRPFAFHIGCVSR